MKAIIMAGGEGSRLRPLTCGKPKPMVPVLNRPIMHFIIKLLKKYGFEEIGVTLQYLPEEIKSYFRRGDEYGVYLKYFIEETPLGTAGSVKNAGKFLDSTFLVISGDALTDLNLRQAVEFHREKGAMATLVLTRVDCPLDYGVIITGQDGSIIRFLEKPTWGEVFSDTVNTGIYILEPEVLSYFEEGRFFDFSKDLFPLLLKINQPLFGLVLPGYWCDVGNLRQYLHAHYDVLGKKVQLDIPGQEIRPLVWAEEGVEISPDVEIRGPALIGKDSRLGQGVEIEPFSVIGKGCWIEHDASIKRSVLWDNVYIGPKVDLRGAVLGNNIKVQANAGVYEGAVIGEEAIVKERSIIKPDIKIWPKKVIETGTVVRQSLVWGTSAQRKIFGLEGVTGLINTEITPEFAVQLGTAFGSLLGSNARVGISSDNYPAPQMLKEAICCGFQSSGCQVLDLGCGITPMHRYGLKALKCKGGIHVKISSFSPDKVNLIFTNNKGGNISRNEERRIENALLREDFQRVGSLKLNPVQFIAPPLEEYLDFIARSVNCELLRQADLKLSLIYDRKNLSSFVSLWCNLTGIDAEHLSIEEPRSWYAYLDLLPDLAEKVVNQKADAGVLLDPNADRLVLVDHRGRIIKDELLTALIALIVLKARGGTVVVPVTAPWAIDTLAKRYQSVVVRTKTAIPDFLEEIFNNEESLNKSHLSQIFLHLDALSALTHLLEFIVERRTSLAELVDEIPEFYLDKKEIPVSWEAKGKVLRRLIEGQSEKDLELLDGVKVFHPEGWALVLPDPEEPFCRIFSEGSSMEIAESLTEMYVSKINEIINS